MIQMMAIAWITALSFPENRAARVVPFRAQRVLRVLIIISLKRKRSVKRTGSWISPLVKVKRTDRRTMLSAIGSKIFPKVVTLFVRRAIRPSKMSVSSSTVTIESRI